MIALTSALTTALIDFAWQGVLIACLLRITLFILRNRSAGARYLVSCFALLAMIAVPVVTACLAFHPAAPSITIPAARQIFASQEGNSQGAAPFLYWLQAWALPAWSLGVLLFSSRLISGCFQLSALKRRGTPAPETIRSAVHNLASRMGLTRTVRVLTSTLADAPGVAGFLRPVILLPVSSLSGLTTQQLEVILAHELAHIRRYDPLVNAVQILIETLLFYHPAVWWTSARIRHERELCCDDVALSCCGDALCYARALTALEKLRGVPAILAIGSTGGSLLYRIRRIMGERPGDYSPSRVSGVLAVAFAIACLAINVTTRIQAQDLPKPQSIYRSPGVEVDTAGAEIVEPVRYPREAAKNAIQGTVVVQADVDARGNVTDARVLSGPPELRKAVLRPVLAMRFKSTGAASTRQITAAFQVPPLQELEKEGRDHESLAMVMADQQKLRAEMDAARQHAQDSSGEEERRRARVMLEHAQKTLAEQLSQFDRVRAVNSEAELAAKIHDSLASVERLNELERSAASMLDRVRNSGMFDGRILAQINAAGLSEEQRVQLMKQLPVRLGDTLSQENVAGIRAAIRAFGDPLRFELIILDNNQALLKIGRRGPALPGSEEEFVRLNQEIAALEAQLEMIRKTYTNQHPDARDFEARLNALRHLREEMEKQRAAAGTGEAPAK